MSARYTKISSPSGDEIPAYVVRAGHDRPRAGIVLLQEIFGINANMRSTADSFAALGYDVVVPDLFWRQEPGVDLDPATPADRDKATGLMKDLDQSLAVKDSLAAAAYVTTLPHASGKVGTVGYCLGGKLAYLLAAADGIEAAVSYYGVAIQASLERAAALRAPLLVHIAVEDHLCPPEAQRAIHDALADRENVTIVDHPGVGHAFARRGGAAFDAKAAERANAATAEFLETHLKNSHKQQ